MIAMMLALLHLPGHSALALGILVPRGPAMAGVTGRYFADAQTAMAAGVDAQWYNPAGLPLGPRHAVAAGAVPLVRQQRTAAGQDEAQLRAGAAFVAMAWGPDPRGDYPRLGAGWHLSWPDAEDISASVDTGSVIDAGSVPADLRGGTDISASFPEGIRREERSTGQGAMQTLSIGAQAGLAASRWFRVGIGVAMERVRLLLHEDVQLSYQGGPAADGSASLSAVTATTNHVTGQVERLVLQAGVQLDLAPGITFGARVRLPSHTIGGLGSARRSVARQSSLVLGGVETSSLGDFALTDAAQVDFDLRTPQVLDLGLAFLFDTLVVEADVSLSEALDSYEVLPAQASGTLSDRVVQLEPTTTSRNAATSYRLGAAMADVAGGTVMAGLAQTDSGVPEDDPLFHAVSWFSVTAGYFRASGPRAWSVGVVYRLAEPGVLKPRPVAGAAGEGAAVSLATAAVAVGGSLAW